MSAAAAAAPSVLRRCAALALLLLGAACNPVDVDQGLVGLTDRCVNQESCAPGFFCQRQRCVVAVGQACREGFPNQSCELFQGVCAATERACNGGKVEASCPPERYGSDYEFRELRCDGLDNDCDGNVDSGPCDLRQGVCAGSQRTCVNGQLQASCTAANYGPLYEPQERSCDGQDNDCNGIPDAANPEFLSLPFEGVPVESQVVPFGQGFLAVTVSRATDTLPDGSPRVQSTVLVQPLGSALLPAGALLRLHEVQGGISSLQVVPHPGGAFVLWMDEVGAVLQPRLARIDAGAGAPTVGVAPRAAPVRGGASLVRAAVSGDGQHLLLASGTDLVRGQRFSLALEPETAELPLSEPVPTEAPGFALARFDVSAEGASGFVAAWAYAPLDAGVTASTTRPRLGFRRLSPGLQPEGEVATRPASQGFVVDLRVSGAAREGAPPFAAWIVSPTRPGPPGPVNPASELTWTALFDPQAPTVFFSPVVTRLALARTAEDVALLASERAFGAVELRRLDAREVRREQVVSNFFSPAPSLSLLAGREPGLVRVVVSGEGQSPYAASACQP